MKKNDDEEEEFDIEDVDDDGKKTVDYGKRVVKLLHDIKRTLLSRNALEKEMLTLEETAAVLSLSKKYVSNLTSCGMLPCYKPGGKRVYYERKDILKYLYSNRIASNDEIAEMAEEHQRVQKCKTTKRRML